MKEINKEQTNRKACIFLLLILSTLSYVSHANNISVSNVTFTGQNTSAGVNNAANYAMVQFNISWENSWRTNNGPANWDAAWVFIKYRANGVGEWHHALLNNSGHVAPNGSAIDAGLLTPGTAFNATTNPAIGAFIYRSAAGNGTFTLNNVQLRWNYAANGLTDGTAVEVQVFVIEMVYVPSVAFFAGDHAASDFSFKQGSNDDDPWYISSESAISVTNSTGSGTGINTTASEYYYSGNNINPGEDITGSVFTIPENFPKGYGKFYCMKYEISQGQYRDFLNTLTYTQQVECSNSHDITVAGNKALYIPDPIVADRNSIEVKTAGIASNLPAVFGCDLNDNNIYNETDDGEWIVCDYLNWADVAAYLDWSGLRPLTELEFEKGCRGDQNAIPGEYAWGTPTFVLADFILNPGTAGETTSPPNANVYNSDILRVGSFATTGSSRESSGAGYYGMMNMSDNVYERCVTVGNATGRLFTGSHGNGVLNANGTADVVNWPDVSALGAGIRGLGPISGGSYMTISGRFAAGWATMLYDQGNFGGRGVRTAP